VTDPLTQPGNRAELAATLDALGVREGTYHLYGAHLDDAIILDHRPEGWIVFYSERGSEDVLAVHRYEESACADLLRRVTADEHAFFQLVAGPAPTEDADAAFGAWLRERGIAAADLAPTEWKRDDVPWTEGPYWRRYSVRILTIRRFGRTTG